MKKTNMLLAGAIAALTGAVGTAQAVETTKVWFDPDGAGGDFTAKEVESFDWLQGNGLAVGGNLSGQTAAGPFPNLALAHSVLSTASLSDGTQVFGGLQSRDITFVLGYPELTTVRAQDFVTLAFDSTNTTSPNFFEIYVGGTTATALTGAGYNDAGGAVKILDGYVTTARGNFQTVDTDGDESATNPLSPSGLIEVFDQAGGNDYSGIYTTEGTGSTVVQIAVTYWDPAYFPKGVEELFVSLNFNVVDPFREIDPSANFNTQDVSGTNSLLAANIGSVNGANNTLLGLLGNPSGLSTSCEGTGDCDFQFQADANNSFRATYAVPEPGSLALLGIGALGLAARTRRRKIR